MKLRNKKTGELVDAWSFYDGNESVNLKYFTDDGQVNLEYRSLAELNDEWEDYKPKEPLIKDEKIQEFLKIVEGLKCSTKHLEERLKNLNEAITEFWGDEE